MRKTHKKSSPKIAILGSEGLLGSDLVRFLSQHYNVKGIDRANYQSQKGRGFDVLINANGNSKRYWANEHPLEDFEQSTLSVYRSLFDFKTNLYIYISSPDVYEKFQSPKTTEETQIPNTAKLSAYGLHKYLAEKIVAHHSPKHLIFRSAAILGQRLSKGPIFDALNDHRLFVSLNSKLQLITAEEFANVLHYEIQHFQKNAIYNIGGRDTFSIKELRPFITAQSLPKKNTPTQVYQMNVSKLHARYPLKTSRQYLQSYLANYNLPGKKISL